MQNTITEGVQIVHSCGDHRTVISSLKCAKDEVHVYDSVYEEVDDDTRTVIQNLFGPERVRISMVEMQKQRDPDDCGLFAIAVATSLVHGAGLCTFR